MTLFGPQSQKDSTRPAFIIGVTGHMDLDPMHRDRVDAQLTQIFGWLASSPNGRDSGPTCQDDALGPGLGLKNTPLVLLSSLAPGADQWVVEKARNVPGLRTLGVLPFFKDQYLRASTFKRDGATIDEDASRFLAKFSDEDVFVVRLRDEVDLDEDQLRERHESVLTGLEGKAERNRRYAAAGEYVAAYSDILIALTDKPLDRCEDTQLIPGQDPGARAIAELKRRGIASDRIPHLPALSWANNGPVIHIYAPRKSKEAPSPVQSPSVKETRPIQSEISGTIEMLYPYDWRPRSGVENQRDFKWKLNGHKILVNIARHLEQFNREKSYDHAREDQAFGRMLPGNRDPSTDSPSGPALPAASGAFREALEQLARLRRRVADWSMQYNAHLVGLKRAMFRLAFCVVLFFSLAENWEGGMPLRIFFFIAALASMVLIWCSHRASAEPAKRSDDYRAIAEGLRVQFYWAACGCGESVASNYLQRQRAELGWICNIINSVSFPYEPFRVWFKRLLPDDKRAVLESIREEWLDGQYVYFKNEHDQLKRREEVFSAYSGVLVSTGLVLTFVLLFTESTHSSVLAVSLLSAGLLILCVLYILARIETHAMDTEATSPVGRSGRSQPGRKSNPLFGVLQNVLFLSERFLPKRIKSPWQRVRVGALVPAFSLFTIGAVSFLETAIPWLPPDHSLIAVSKNLAFAGGVLCGLWVEINFFQENIQRYRSMYSLFHSAGTQFDYYYKLLKSVRLDKPLEAEQYALKKIQDLLVEVGREALSENAEWLIAHRSRPLEPVSALG